jgi:mono/diheme cytochrome c family protein
MIEPGAPRGSCTRPPGARRVGRWMLAVPLSCALWVFGLRAVTFAHDPISTRVTWAREISSIVERRCLACHTRGGFGPFSLTTYESARPWAVAIKEEVLAGHMPPWSAAAGIGEFANDRRLTRHEMELIAAWVDGGAPKESPGTPGLTVQTNAASDGSGVGPGDVGVRQGGLVVPLASTVITEAVVRDASVTLQLPDGYILRQWTFEPGAPAVVERADLEVDQRWLGTWIPGERTIEFPGNAGAVLPTSAHITARIAYRQPPEPVTDFSRLRIWVTPATTTSVVRTSTVVRSWRTTAPVKVFAVRPARDDVQVEALARFADGHAIAIGVFDAAIQIPHPTYQLASPLMLPTGARVEATGPLRLLYVEDGTRTVKRNVRTRPLR